MKRQINQCFECDSEYYADSSKMLGLCPECSHHIYGYKNCEHLFENGRCAKCYWDGNSTVFIEELKNSTKQSSEVMKVFEINGNDFNDLNSFYDVIGTRLLKITNGVRTGMRSMTFCMGDSSKQNMKNPSS